LEEELFIFEQIDRKAMPGGRFYLKILAAFFSQNTKLF